MSFLFEFYLSFSQLIYISSLIVKLKIKQTLRLQQQNHFRSRIISRKQIMDVKLLLQSNHKRQINDSSQTGLNRIQNQEKVSPYGKKNRQRSANYKQKPSCQSPTSTRLSKAASKVIEPSQSAVDKIGETQSQIHHLIDELDFKLKTNYHLKENNLIESYREQIIRAHKDLIDLKNNNNEQQIKNQMNEKSLQMKKERLELIQTNMFFSNKCNEYKKLLDQKVSQADQLEREVKFLEKQINNSHQKRIELMSQVYQNNSPIKDRQKPQSNDNSSDFISLQTLKFQTEKKKPTLNQDTSNKKTSLSTHANTQVMKKINLSSASIEKIKNKLERMPELNNQVKKLFEQKLMGQQNSYTDRSNISIKNGTMLSKLSALNGQKSEKKNQKRENSEIQNLFMKSVNQIKEKRGIKKDITLFKGQEFTDIEKKEIMKSFLSQQEVKQYIYNIIFEKTDDLSLFRKNSIKDKFKIVASDKKQIV